MTLPSLGKCWVVMLGGVPIPTVVSARINIPKLGAACAATRKCHVYCLGWDAVIITSNTWT